MHFRVFEKVARFGRLGSWRHIFLFGSMFLAFQGAFSMNVDSLLLVSETVPHDTSGVVALIKISTQLRNEGAPQAKDVAIQAVDLAQALGDQKYLADAQSVLGTIYNIGSNYEEALKNYLASAENYRAVGNEMGIAKCKINISSVYINRNNFQIAEPHLIEAKEIIDRLNIEKYKITVNTNLAIVYTEAKKFEEAEQLHEESLMLLQDSDDYHQLSVCYSNLGYLFDMQSQYPPAYRYYKLAYETAQKGDGLYYEAGFALQNMIVMLVELDRPQEARAALDELWPISKRAGSPRLMAETYHASASVYEHLGNYKQAYTDFMQFTVINDSLINEDQNAKMTEMQKEHEFLKRDATIERIELERSQMQAQQTQQKADAHRQLIFIVVLSILGLLLLLGLVLTIFLMLGRNRAIAALRANQDLIQSQHREIELQNEALKLQNDRLEDLNREKDGLVGIVAHDLKSPLNKALALSELLKLQGSLNEDQERSVEMMGMVASAGNDLIRDLLDLNALEHPESDMTPEPVNLVELWRELEIGFAGEAQRKAILMHFELPAEIPPFMIHRKSLQRIMDNLTSNALKFSPKGRQIWVRAALESERYLHIEIQDQGPGINEADQQKLFKKFQRLSARPTAGENSTGLGLAITHALVQKLSGEIWLSSSPNEGTVFHLMFEAHKE